MPTTTPRPSSAPAPIVIKIGGVALEQQSTSPTLWRHLLALSQRHPGGVVLVHGGGKAVDRLLGQLGMETTRHDGLRITPADQMDVIAGVLAGTLNKSLVGCVNAAGGRGVGLCLSDGMELQCERMVRIGVELGRVGVVRSDLIRPDHVRLLPLLLREGYLPVVACVGMDATGGFLNINGDDAAAGVAKALSASSLVLLTDVAGVLDEQKQLIATLTTPQIHDLAQRGVITGGMLPKLLAASDVANNLGTPVTIMSGSTTSDLERWAQGESVGTRILPSNPVEHPVEPRPLAR
jgi:acetylglutamate kinase